MNFFKKKKYLYLHKTPSLLVVDGAGLKAFEYPAKLIASSESGSAF